jgi:uncharacterized membrane protein (UPF0182 family)
MYKFLTKNGQLIAFGVGALITVIFIVVAFMGLDEFNALDKVSRPGSDIFNFGISASIFLIIVCFSLMIIFGIYQVATNFKSSMKGIIGFGVIVIIFIIASNMVPTSMEEISPYVAQPMIKYEVSLSNYGLISGGIMTAIVLGVGAVLAFVGSEVLNFFK